MSGDYLPNEPERIGDLWVGPRDGGWRVSFSLDDILEGPYCLVEFPTEAEATAYAQGYVAGATP